MSAERYSIYQAKAKLSEIIRKVKQHRTIVISDRGRDVARVVPMASATSLAKRLEGLAEVGLLVAGPDPDPSKIVPITRRRGALARFLRTRHRY